MLNNPGEPRYLIIPAAGLGTRMRAVNSEIPKEMLTIGNKPAIQYAVDEGITSGISNIILIINKCKEIIRDFIEKQYQGADTPSRAISFTFLYQKEPLGESDALGYAKDIVGDHAAAVIYPDNVYLSAPGALKVLIPVYQTCRKDVIALSKVSPDIARTISNAGRVDVTPLNNDIYNISNFIPKGDGYFVPRYKDEPRACGIYITGPHLFDHIEMTRGTVREGEFTDYTVRTSILKERDIIGYLLAGPVFDIGNPKGYDLCLQYINENRNPG